MRNLSGSPRVQVHVSNAEALYLHVKRTGPSEKSQRTMSEDRSPLRPSANVKTRLPWIPPGKTSYKWEGPTHCLEIKPPEPEPEPELRLSDLTSEDEQRLRGRISQYEKKIESLMSEVSSLKTEVEHRRKEQVLGRKSEQQDVSQRVTTKQEEELGEESKELQEWKNSQLRESIGRILQENRQSRYHSYLFTRVLGSLPVYWCYFLCSGVTSCVVGSLPVYWGYFLCSGVTSCVVGLLPV
ncbi:outer dense fiber protein 2-like isoform X2 [Poecilia formosa]|nr:PREDICTED: outer dense fiber protein 2-like isoform X2 [Poecilia formosa]